MQTDFSQLDFQTPVELINQFARNTLLGALGIVVTRVSPDEICAEMPVAPQTSRPGGMLHGGASLAMAETLAGLGSMLLVDMVLFDVRGIQVSANHTQSLREGKVLASAKIVHQGNHTHIWNVDLTSEDGKLISSARVTNMIVKRNG